MELPSLGEFTRFHYRIHPFWPGTIELCWVRRAILYVELNAFVSASWNSVLLEHLFQLWLQTYVDLLILLIAPIIWIANNLCSRSLAIIGDIEKETNIIKQDGLAYF